MKIAVIQFEPIIGDLDETLKRIDSLYETAKDADLVVLPELANSGYNFKDKTEAIANSETINNSRFVSYLKDKTKKYNQYIVSGFNELDGEKLYNSSLFIGNGEIIGKYRKLHLFLNEKNIFEPGDLGLPIFKLGDYKLGMLICFDWMFPEAWRSLAVKGADIICHPSNLVLPYAQQAVPVHSLINRVFTVTANRVGVEGNLIFTGQSIISNPKGIVINRASTNKEEVIISEVDLSQANDKMITERNHAFDDIRNDCY